MHPDLSFEQVPPLSVPLRFFLTAPWFGVAAGLLLATAGPDALASRWSPATLAATHLLALGFMLQVMVGALFQFLPVGAGQAIAWPLAVAAAVHLLLTAGTALLATGFLAGAPALLLAAAVMLVTGIVTFTFAAAAALWRGKSAATATPLLQLALAALVVTAALGALLAAGLARGLSLPYPGLTDVHLAWGSGGWVLALLVAVSSFVVPMFQLTPPYPAWLARSAAPALALLLVLFSLRLAPAAPGWSNLAGLGLALLAAGYALVTLRLQQRGRRKARDATGGFFRAGMTCLILFAAGAVAMLALPTFADDPRSAIWLGVLLFPGAFSCVIIGMLYKIVPFLGWLHLQRTGAPVATLPNMRAFVAESSAHRHLVLHLSALVLLAAAVAVPTLVRPAGVLLAASYLWLGLSLLAALLRYRAFRGRIPSGAAVHGS